MNRANIEALISAVVTFFGVLLIVAFAIGVSSQGALKGPDAFVLRWTVISLMVTFSAVVAWVRWKFFSVRDCRLRGSAGGARAETDSGASSTVSRPLNPLGHLVGS